MIKYKGLEYVIKGVVGDRVILKPKDINEYLDKSFCESKYIRTIRENPSFKLTKNRNGFVLKFGGKTHNITEELKEFASQYIFLRRINNVT